MSSRARPSRRRLTLSASLAFVLAAALGALAPGAAQPVEPLQGLDPVLLAEGEEVLGDESITLERGAFRYSFASAETRARFEADPERYEIQYGGACARMITAEGNPDLYAVHDGKIYVFGSSECWQAFTASPESYVDDGERPPLPVDPAAAQRGREWVERAAAAIGGARLDSLRAYREVGRSVIPRASGEVTVPIRSTHRFPGLVRVDQTRSFGELTVVTTPAEAFQATANGVREFGGFQRDFLARGFRREPLLILRARGEAGFRAVALGAASVDGRAVERVAVELAGERLTLALDREEGLPVGLSFRGRGPESTLGEVEIRYADFRDVGGLRVPFVRRATFDGEPFPALSVTLDEAVADPELEPDFFERPAREAS